VKSLTKDRGLGNSVKALLDGGKAADLALFGRMIADLPDRNVDGSCQVAHALSTNTVNVEFDFYTAVDDLKPEDTAGADMLGTVEFNSACYYRYANVDVAQLCRNLDGDEELAQRTLEAFLRASITAVPTGKQNSMAAQNPPSLVFTVVRRAGLWSLANAFVKPIRLGQDDNLVQRSIQELDTYWGWVAKMYGEGQIVGKWVCALEDDRLTNLARDRADGVDNLIGATVQEAMPVGGVA
jgi:CRISPR system Cascade subunit CasC